MELPAQEREHCVVIGRNYGHAGSLEYWSQRHPLPPVYSTHNNYWFWGPPSASTDVYLVTGGNPEELESLFEQVRFAGEVVTPYAQEARITIWVCRGLREAPRDVWIRNRNFI
jgi:hypothetical protein